MFTGIIEGLGTIKKIKSSGQSSRITIDTGFSLESTKIGDSIAVNGTCLTAVEINQNQFDADVAPETLDKTVIGDLHPGDRVNLERALRLSDRLDGHLVSGHVDGTGLIEEKQPLANAIIIKIKLPEDLARYTIQKGSIAIDGISLTINECGDGFIKLSIVPHTAKLTTIGFKKPGDRVNIETDVIGKYIEQFVSRGRNANGTKDSQNGSSVTMDLLAKKGFL